MEEILHQLIGIVYPMIYIVLYILGGAGFLPSREVGHFQIVSLSIDMLRLTSGEGVEERLLSFPDHLPLNDRGPGSYSVCLQAHPY